MTNGQLLVSCVLLVVYAFSASDCHYVETTDVDVDTLEHVDPNAVPELKYLDLEADPCDNFYKFTCGNFKKFHPLPDDRNVQIVDQYTILQDQIHDLVKDILEQPDWPDEPESLRKAKTFYGACADLRSMDRLTMPQLQVIQALGGFPAITLFPVVGAFSWDRLGDIVSEYGVQFFLNLQVIPNNFNGTENVIILQEDALANPSNIRDTIEPTADEYLSQVFARDENLLPVHKFYNQMAFRLRDLRAGGIVAWKPEQAISRDIGETIEFMRNVSSKGLNSIEIPISDITTLPINPSITQLQEWTDKYFGPEFGLNWMSFLQRVFQRSGTIIRPEMRMMVTSTVNLYGLLNLVRATEYRVLQNFIVVRLLTYMAPDSNTFMMQSINEFYFNYKWPVYTRDKYCVRKILGYSGDIAFGYALTYEYQKYHFNNNKIRQVQQMFKDLYATFSDMLRTSDWMDDESRLRALEKSARTITLLAYPAQASDVHALNHYYRNLRVCSWDHFGNAQRLRAFRQALNLQQMGNGRQRDVWTLSPLEANAVYNRPNNRILLPVIMLNPAFYSGLVDAIDYGRLGAIIGHEISHGFDESGRLYDENGDRVDWWTNETKMEFARRSECFKKQYSNYYIEEIKKYVNGNQTINENIADNGGVREAYRALQKLKSTKTSLKTVAGYSTDQLFFIGYGTMWCMTETDYYLNYMQDKSEYAPGRYRVNGPTSNMDEFAHAFNCPAGSPMNPIEKCALW